MLKPNFLLFVATIFFLQSCHQGERGEKALKNYITSADTLAMSGTDLADLSSDERYVIRKADIRCRVPNVQEAVAGLEAFAVMAGGFVQESHTRNELVSKKLVEYGNDSVKTAQVYRPAADVLIRVPYFALDTLSDEVNRIAAFIDYRNMSRDDVTLAFIANMLKNEQAGDNKPTVSAGAEKVEGRQYTDAKHEQQVDRRIANLAMLDDSRFATLKLELYQPEQVAVFVTQNADKMVAAGFGEQISKSLGYGADILKGGLLMIVTLWPVWLVAVPVVLLYRKRVKRTKVLIVQNT